MVRRRDLYYELITLQKKLANTLVDGNHKQGLILRIKELTKKIELETQNIYLDVKEIDLIEFRQQIINKYPDLREIFYLFWFTFSPFLDVDETLSYNGFERFNTLLFFALVGNKNDMDARNISKLDYDYYIKIYNKIDKIAFFDILFKILVDWTDKDDILYYCCFMWSLLDTIADLKWTPPRLRPKREIKNLLKTETDVTMFGRYFESKNIREISLQRFESWKTLDSKAKSRVASRRVGSNLDESQIKAIADIFYSKTCITADDNENTDSDADLDDDQGDENINVRDENINAHTKHSPKQKSPVTTEKSHEDEFYERLRNVKGKVNSWNNRAFDLYRWDPDDKDMLDSIYNERGHAIKKLKYFESDDFIDDQMEEANVHAINVIKKFDNSFKARETMYEKKHIVREREVREKVIVPSRPNLNSKPRITPIMLQAKQIVKERGIGAFMQATKVTAAKESKKSWQTLAKIMENRNKRRLKRETMMMTSSHDSKPFAPSSSLLDEIEEEDDDEFEELGELLHQLKEEAKIENTIKSLSAEELFQLEFEENEKISVDAIDLSAEESIPALVDTYLNELNEGNRPDDMTDGFSEADEFILTDSFSPSHVLKSKNSHKQKELSQSAFLVLKSSVPPETRLKMKDELDNRKKIRKGKDPLFPRSFITSSGEFLTASNIQWRSNMEKEMMTSNNEARKALNSAMKKSKYDIKAQTVNDVRHIKDEIEATKKNQFMKDVKRFDQIRSFKHFRHQMISYLKESKNPHTTDCMRYMNEKMVSIILNTYSNVDPKVLIRELFETIEQNDKFINESSNNSKERDIISHGLSSNTYTLRNEDLNFLNEDQQVENWDRTEDYRDYDLSKFETENCQLENIETISTKELLLGKFSPLAAVRNIHPEQHGNRKNWNESSPGWQTFGSGFRSQSQSPTSISNSHNHQSHFPSTRISSSDHIIKEYLNLDLGESVMSGELKSNNSYHDNDDNDIYDNALNKNLFAADIDNNNDDDKSIDDSIDGERKNTIFVKLDSPREEAPSQRFIKTPELHLSREVTPASNKKIISNDMIKKKLLHESIPQENPSFYFEGEGSKTDVMSVNTTNMIINQNKNSMKLQPITPPALFSVDSFSIGISPQLFDTKLFEKSRLVRNNSNQASAIRMRKSNKYNELKLFPSKSVGNISNSVDVNSIISKDKIIEKLNELKLKEATNCLYSTKSQTIEGRYRSGKSITPKRELLNKLHGRGDKVLRPFCGM